MSVDRFARRDRALEVSEADRETWNTTLSESTSDDVKRIALEEAPQKDKPKRKN